MKFIFVHRHEVFLATSKKLASNCYSVNGYKEVKINEEMKLSTLHIFRYFAINVNNFY